MRRLIGGEFERRANIKGRGGIEQIVPSGVDVSLWGGAGSALRVLIRALKLGPGDVILFPSYLCPSILVPFRQAGVAAEFYRVDQHLVIDVDSLDRSLASNDKIKAVFFINYFGFLQPPEVLAYLRGLRQRGVVVIEDGVQALFTDGVFLTGDWGIASLRKWLYIDAGLLAGRGGRQVENTAPGMGFSPYKLHKHLGIRARELYLYGGPALFEGLYLKLIKAAERYYSEDTKIRELSYEDKQRLKRGIDWQALINRRRRNFLTIGEALRGQSQITPVYQECSHGVCPLGFPVKVEAGIRDEIIRALAAEKIFCPVHWRLGEYLPERFADSLRLSVEVFTIPVDQRYGPDDMEYIAGCIKKIFKNRRG